MGDGATRRGPQPPDSRGLEILRVCAPAPAGVARNPGAARGDSPTGVVEHHRHDPKSRPRTDRRQPGYTPPVTHSRFRDQPAPRAETQRLIEPASRAPDRDCEPLIIEESFCTTEMLTGRTTRLSPEGVETYGAPGRTPRSGSC
jgi:hypothetical protein